MARLARSRTEGSSVVKMNDKGIASKVRGSCPGKTREREETRANIVKPKEAEADPESRRVAACLDIERERDVDELEIVKEGRTPTVKVPCLGCMP